MNQKKARRLRALSREIAAKHGMVESRCLQLAIKPPKGSPARRDGCLWRIVYWVGRERLYRTMKRTTPTKWHRGRKQPSRRVPAVSEWQALAAQQLELHHKAVDVETGKGL